MARRKWVHRYGKLIEVDPHTYRAKNQSGTFNNILSDTADFQTIDGDVIGGRAGLREYQIRTGTRQVGTELKKPVDHDTAVRQSKENLINLHQEANIPLRYARGSWQEYK